ncbi:MAG: molybdenum cofactor guanylyltransferase [Myxococcales bacterium]|jgi:molybdopterin-guanine dinucleotide biosynthesis protein A|nr:molybdenum cofactor guanylyltransferase [Myxococcales bacterium]MBL0194361.1 molybdenum cofactor guanylyltransferase [Myxococcales bacterium]
MGSPKGLLTLGGRPLVERWLAVLERLGVPYVLVGARPEYAHLPATTLADSPAGVGPLGGLSALLEHAEARGFTAAVAVACDMPYVDEALLARLLARGPAPAVAARRDGRWEPFFARYDVASLRPLLTSRLAEGRHDLQGLLALASTVELSLTDEERGRLRDWDTPADVAADTHADTHAGRESPP